MLCNHCQQDKPETDFETYRYRKKDKTLVIKRRSRCFTCKVAMNQQNPNYQRNQKRWYQDNKSKVLQASKVYYRKNKSTIIAQANQRMKTRRKIDVPFRILECLRSRLRAAIRATKHGKKSHSTRELLGCSIGKLKTHLESQFKDGMCWENHGQFGWHIDHIKPCKSFNLTQELEQKKCFHYTNLQPLWWRDNIVKD